MGSKPILALAQGTSRAPGAKTLLFVLTAQNCDGCKTLKGQIDKHWAAVENKALVVLGEGGDLRGPCFFAVKVGDITLHAPGLPTAYVMTVDGDHLKISASSMGPLDESDKAGALAALIGGKTRFCREARGASIKIDSDEPLVGGATLSQLVIPIPEKQRR